MKIYQKTASIVPLILLLFLFSGVAAYAGEDSAGDWRPLYDKIMSWVNFVIFVIVLVKLAKEPLMGFLRGRKDELAREISRIEEARENATSEIHKTLKSLEESEARFARMKERIVTQGEQRKNEIIEEAKMQSRLMLEAAKRKTESRIHRAKENFRAELVDAAIEIAYKKLPKEINETDNERLIAQFLQTSQQ